MKRALLITGGTLGSLAAVFAITPPQIASNQTTLDMGGTGTTPTTTPTAVTTAPATSTPTTTAPATSTPTKKATKGATSPAQSTATPTKTTAVTQAPVAPTPATQSVSGKFTGDLSNTGPYGGVITQITVASGVITDIQVLQSPGGKNQRYTDRAIPTMRQRALAAQSDQITAVSGASYTSYNFWKSLTSALTKAGLK
jgi:uncharacterized protein with FMN-binding domain